MVSTISPLSLLSLYTFLTIHRPQPFPLPKPFSLSLCVAEDVVGRQVPAQNPRQDHGARGNRQEPQEAGALPSISPPILGFFDPFPILHITFVGFACHLCSILLLGFGAGLPSPPLLWALRIWQENPNLGLDQANVRRRCRKGRCFDGIAFLVLGFILFEFRC